jgi:hypothetical protein
MSVRLLAEMITLPPTLHIPQIIFFSIQMRFMLSD